MPADGMGDDEALSRAQLRRLLEIGQSLVTELDLEELLRQLLETAKELTRARYAALGVIDLDTRVMERFLYLGIDDEMRSAIGRLPQGRGVLGELIRDSSPLRLREISDHPRSHGFPPGHPKMHSFLGVPILIQGEAYGNIYLTEKEGAEEFSRTDQELLSVLADWAAVAIGNARLYVNATRARADLARAVKGLEATLALSRLATPDAELESLLEQLATRGLALLDAESFLLVREDEAHEPVLAAAAGEVPENAPGTALRGEARAAAEQLGRDPHRDGPGLARAVTGALGIESSQVLAAPLLHRGRSEGSVLVTRSGGASFGDDDRTLLEAFAAGAANAISLVSGAEQDRRREAVRASERERSRWARELHDETLQQLAALKLLCDNALARDAPEGDRDTIRRASYQFNDVIEGLERLIADLRPAVLDEFGPEAAIRALAEKVARRQGWTLGLELDLAHEHGRVPTRYTPELEVALYRIVQESLTNAAKHAEAESVRVRVVEDGAMIKLDVSDDGRGINGGGGGGFGLRGMRERVELTGGELHVESAPGGGTAVHARLPVRRR